MGKEEKRRTTKTPVRTTSRFFSPNFRDPPFYFRARKEGYYAHKYYHLKRPHPSRISKLFVFRRELRTVVIQFPVFSAFKIVLSLGTKFGISFHTLYQYSIRLEAQFTLFLPQRIIDSFIRINKTL